MMKQHDSFQKQIDQIWQENKPIEIKLNNLIRLCSSNYTLLKQLLHYFFIDEQCDIDQYFYLTFTYQDKPLQIDKTNELALSLILNDEAVFLIEIDIYHYPKQDVICHTIIEDDKITTCLLDFKSNEGEILNVEFIKKEI